jgi:hypothetical protein
MVSISPSGDFDGPEEGNLWGVPDEVVIARPAHLGMTFNTYVDLSLRYKHENVTTYIEYFPLSALGEKELKDVFTTMWSNFLEPRFTLLWMGESLCAIT